MTNTTVNKITVHKDHVDVDVDGVQHRFRGQSEPVVYNVQLFIDGVLLSFSGKCTLNYANEEAPQ